MISNDGAGDRAALQASINRTRAELGETVEALTARADVRGRLRSSMLQTRAQLRQRAGRAAGAVRGPLQDAGSSARRNPVPWGVVGASVAGVLTMVIVILVKRGRRR
ncbi:hypothetical protein GCM10027290_13370 [Micromonospora sonneratiae]|uniref:DUF3618 domain-containing protein n=1 Tax=Micromonospora sonneratiae TaxID=1184706 RepID=A0ABW3YN02_9ACTN